MEEPVFTITYSQDGHLTLRKGSSEPKVIERVSSNKKSLSSYISFRFIDGTRLTLSFNNL